MSDGILNRCYEDEIRALRAQDARHRDAVNYWIGESDRLRAALAEKDAAYKWACEDQAELRAALEAAERQRDWWKDHELELAQERNDLGKALAEAQAERDALKEQVEAVRDALSELHEAVFNRGPGVSPDPFPLGHPAMRKARAALARLDQYPNQTYTATGRPSDAAEAGAAAVDEHAEALERLAGHDSADLQEGQR